MTKKGGGGLFSFGGSKDKGQPLMGGGKKVKNTILLALGYVTSYAQPKYVSSLFSSLSMIFYSILFIPP